jgi:predicted amidohydrolase
LAGAKLGLLLGADIEAPEPARALALAGTDALIVMAVHGRERALAGGPLLRTRAFENGCPLAYANGSPDPDGPPSCILGPDGGVLAEAGDGLAVADLPPVVASPAARPCRRPRLYQKLAAAIPGEDGPRA